MYDIEGMYSMYAAKGCLSDGSLFSNNQHALSISQTTQVHHTPKHTNNLLAKSTYSRTFQIYNYARNIGLQ